MSELEIKKFSRRPFDVNAVQVTLDNIDELTEWCKGRKDQAPTKMMGTETMLPCIKLPGQGANKKQEFTANIGSWIVEFKGNFRVYKPVQFRATFVEFDEGHKEGPVVEEWINSENKMVELPDVTELQSSL